MKIKVREGSDYLKGMLLIAKQDRKIADSEILLIQHVGKALEYCPKGPRKNNFPFSHPSSSHLRPLLSRKILEIAQLFLRFFSLRGRQT